MHTSSMTRNIFLALLLSFAATCLLAVIYALYPLISAMASALISIRADAGSGGIGAVAGGASESLLLAILVAEPVLSSSSSPCFNADACCVDSAPWMPGEI